MPPEPQTILIIIILFLAILAPLYWRTIRKLQATAIYANAVGEEERNIVEEMWK